MDLIPILPLVGTVVGGLLTMVPQWLNSQGSRRQKRADIQEQTIKDLQDAMAALEPICAIAGVSRRTQEQNAESDDPEETQFARKKHYVETFQSYTAAKRRAEILMSRVEDSLARQLSTEMIQSADVRFRSDDEAKAHEHHFSMGEKFTRANDRLGEVLRSLH